MASEALGHRMPGRTLQGPAPHQRPETYRRNCAARLHCRGTELCRRGSAAEIRPEAGDAPRTRAGPDHHGRDAPFHGGRSNLVATLGRDTAAAYELEGARFADHRVPRRGQNPSPPSLATIDALNDGALVQLVVDRTCADDKTPVFQEERSQQNYCCDDARPCLATTSAPEASHGFSNPRLVNLVRLLARQAARDFVRAETDRGIRDCLAM